MDPRDTPPSYDTVMTEHTPEHVTAHIPSCAPEEFQTSVSPEEKDSMHYTDRNTAALPCTIDTVNNLDTTLLSSEVSGQPELLKTRMDSESAAPEPEKDNLKPKPRRGAKTRRMKKRYVEMMELREEVLQIRNELMPLYEVLNNEAQKLRQSGDVFLSSLEGEMRDLLPHKQAGYLRLLWDEVHTCGVAFNNTIERALEYENLLRDPHEELMEAESYFLEAAELVTASKSVTDVSEHQEAVKPCEEEAVTANAEEPLPATHTSMTTYPYIWTNFITPSEASARDRRAYEVEESDSEPLVWSHLRERKVYLQQMRERLASLDGDHEEEKIERDLLLDRGDEPDTPESEFEEKHMFYREKNLQRIDEALRDVERLKTECLAQGLDPEPPRRHGDLPIMDEYTAQDIGCDSTSKPEGQLSPPPSAREDDAISTKAELESQADSGSGVSAGHYRDGQFELRFGAAPVRRPAERPTRVLEWLQGSSGERKISDASNAKQIIDDITAGASHEESAHHDH